MPLSEEEKSESTFSESRLRRVKSYFRRAFRSSRDPEEKVDEAVFLFYRHFYYYVDKRKISRVGRRELRRSVWKVFNERKSAKSGFASLDETIADYLEEDLGIRLFIMSLDEMQQEILKGLLAGFSLREISQRLSLPYATVHAQNRFMKLKVLIFLEKDLDKWRDALI